MRGIHTLSHLFPVLALPQVGGMAVDVASNMVHTSTLPPFTTVLLRPSSQADYTDLDTGLMSNCERLVLQPTDVFIEKVWGRGEGGEEVLCVFSVAARACADLLVAYRYSPPLSMGPPFPPPAHTFPLPSPPLPGPPAV